MNGPSYMRVSMRKFFLLCGFALVLSSASLAQETKPETSPLDGASSLSETHGDWTVNCQVVNGAKVCRFSQQQFGANNSNQRLLAIEFSVDQPDTAQGTIAMPFGLNFSSGVSMTIDDVAQGQALSFTTCYVIGCLVPLPLDQPALEKFKTGKVLSLDAIAAETNQPVNFKISLKGFASAYQRTRKLVQN
jgi:invasion protein IalB